VIPNEDMEPATGLIGCYARFSETTVPSLLANEINAEIEAAAKDGYNVYDVEVLISNLGTLMIFKHDPTIVTPKIANTVINVDRIIDIEQVKQLLDQHGVEDGRA